MVSGEVRKAPGTLKDAAGCAEVVLFCCDEPTLTALEANAKFLCDDTSRLDAERSSVEVSMLGLMW